LRGNKRPFGALIACFAILGMIAGGAVAFPARFHAIVSKAQEVLHRGGTADARDAAAHRNDASSGAKGSTPDGCQTSISGILQDPPGTQDVRSLQHAIAVVEADCQKNPNARGLLNALMHMLANAQKHPDHPSHAGGNGKGRGNANGNGNGNGVGHDPPRGGHGHGHAYGHGDH